MALGFTPVEQHVVGDLDLRIVDVAFDSSYPSGGEAVTADNLGFRNSIVHIFDGVARKPATDDLAVSVTFDKANGKLVAIWGDNSSASDSPNVEVANTTSLSGYVARVVALGK